MGKLRLQYRVREANAKIEFYDENGNLLKTISTDEQVEMKQAV
jgi:hypothetical protein